MRLQIEIPVRGEKPSEFRREFLEAVRDAAAHMHFDGKLDADIVEEIYRALPVEIEAGPCDALPIGSTEDNQQ